jgi:integrase
LPMSDFVHDMLVSRRALGNAGFVFPGKGRCGHISDTDLPLIAVEQATGIKVSPHDLRRTFSTVADSAGVSMSALKAMLNHAVGNDVTSGYVVITTDALREPVQRVADRMKELCGVAPISGENVKKLRR